ncbi:MAG TPA: SusE domain-containing protein [Chitinophagaceae bacterium]
MRKILNFIFLLAGATVLLTACDKANDLPHYAEGKATVMTASSTTIASLPADSNNTALTLSWTYPDHATDSANIKYTVEIDSTGKNFARAATKVVMGQSSVSYLAKELNNILLAKGYAFNVPVDMDVRVISSYGNNNERLNSNVVKIRMTPYKIPPKVVLPTSGKLFIVGGATQGGWTNPVPTPSQELTRIDETTFGGIFQLTGGQYYLLLPLNGDWGHKYSVANNALPGLNTGGDFGYDFAQDIPGPTTTGLYKIMVDFQSGKFTVTPFTQQHGLPTELFVVGDASPGGWSNPVPVPSQQFTRLTSTRFELASLAMTNNKNYLFLPANGSWAAKFGAVDNTATGIKMGGPFKPEGQDMPSPDVAGNYKITVDFINNTYTLVKL